MKAAPEFSRKKPCPPHGPFVVDASEGGYYVACCLKCGLAGSAQEDALKAKLAFEKTWH